MSQEPQQPPAPTDDNQLIAERRQKLAAIRARGIAFPNDFKPTHHAADLHQRHGQVPNEELGAAGGPGSSGRSHDAQARDGQGLFRDPAGRVLR